MAKALNVGDEVEVLDTAVRGGTKRQAFVRAVEGFRLDVYIPKYGTTFSLWEGVSNRGRFRLVTDES